MSDPVSAREALIIEAIGDVAILIDRVEALTPAILQAWDALAEVNAELPRRLAGFEKQMAAIVEQTRTKSIENIARRTDQAVRRSVEEQTIAMQEAARAIFQAEVSSALRRVTAALQPPAARAGLNLELWLTHAAAAAAAATVAWGSTLWWLSR